MKLSGVEVAFQDKVDAQNRTRQTPEFRPRRKPQGSRKVQGVPRPLGGNEIT
jgi:hypothetical protein